MRKMKLVWAAVVLIFSCGEAVELTPPLELKLATAEASGHPLSFSLKRFAQLISAKTRDTLKIRILYSQKTGADRIIMEKLKSGGLEIACLSPFALTSCSEGFAALTLPFIFENESHYRRALEGEIGIALLKSLQPQGFEGIGFFEAGPLHWYGRRRALASPQDFARLKFFVPSRNPFLKQYIGALGGYTPPLSEDRLSQALQAGIVDAAAGSLSAYDSGGLETAARFITRLPHTRQPLVMIISKKTARRLSPVVLETLRAAAGEAERATAPDRTRWEQNYLEKLKGRGVMIKEPEVINFLAPAETVFQNLTGETKLIADKIRSAR